MSIFYQSNFAGVEGQELVPGLGDDGAGQFDQQAAGVVDVFDDAPVTGVVPLEHDLFAREVGAVPVLFQELRVGEVFGPVEEPAAQRDGQPGKRVVEQLMPMPMTTARGRSSSQPTLSVRMPQTLRSR